MGKTMRMNPILNGKLILGAALIAGTIAISSCGKKDPNSPGIEYMPDMYRATSIETYLGNSFYDDSMASRQPVAGTIPRNFEVYPYPNTPEGYEAAGTNLKNPIPFSDAVMAEGEATYGKFCVHCHGNSGGGDGNVAGKLPGPPPPFTGAALANLPEGKIFHSIHYGKGMMGPHGLLLNKTERWKLVYYIQKLQGKTPGQATAATADTTIKAK